MKIILPLILLAVLASCGPSRYLECPKYVGIAVDTIPVQLMDSNHGGLLPATIACGGYLSEAICKTPDTVPEWMHVSRYHKGFVIVQTALAVRDNGYCIAHLDCDKKPFPEHYRVGWCEGKEELLNRLVKGRAR
jgi:hypothetical protein